VTEGLWWSSTEEQDRTEKDKLKTCLGKNR